MKDALLKYAHYNKWANTILVTLLTNKAPEFIEKEIASSYPTIKHTFLHIADAELIWHSRLTGGAFPALPSKTDQPINCLLDSNNLLIDFISSKDNDYFKQATTYKNLKGEEFTSINDAVFTHVFNHGTFHRGQIVSMLRNAGYTGKIESTDFISYDRL